MNCVIVTADGRLEGHNFEAFGYAESLAQAVPGWRADAGPVVLLGAGGGARAVVAGLTEHGAREIRVINRSPERAQKLAADLGPRSSLCHGRAGTTRWPTPPSSSTRPARACTAIRPWISTSKNCR